MNRRGNIEEERIEEHVLEIDDWDSLECWEMKKILRSLLYNLGFEAIAKTTYIDEYDIKTGNIIDTAKGRTDVIEVRRKNEL